MDLKTEKIKIKSDVLAVRLKAATKNQQEPLVWLIFFN